MRKKIIIGFAAAILTGSAAACGQSNSNSADDETEHTEIPEAYSALGGSEDLPETLPDIVPLFEPASVRSAMALGSDAWIIKLVTDASKDEVKDFYETAFSENGFELTDDFSDGFSSAEGVHRAEDTEVHAVVNDGRFMAGIDDEKTVIDLAVSLGVEQ